MNKQSPYRPKSICLNCGKSLFNALFCSEYCRLARLSYYKTRAKEAVKRGEAIA